MSDFEMIAKTFNGFEEILAEEIKDLGGTEIELLKRAVLFTGDQKLLYRANYELRSSLAILVPIFKFKANTVEDLYDGTQKIDWTEFLSLDKTFSIHTTINSEYFTHSRFAVLKVKDAIADQFREKFNERPSVDAENPDLRINLHISDEDVTISLDSSGDPLYKRGYRKRVGEAHLNEVLAAGLILLTDWKGEKPLLDPMCGSGTILAEAAMKLTNTPAGKFRKSFGFQKWKDYDEELFLKIKKIADEKIKPSEVKLTGFDSDAQSVENARINLDFIQSLVQISVIKADFLRMKPPYAEGLIIVNPPYGERLKIGNVSDLYQEMGNVLKHTYMGYQAWVISSNFEAIKNIGLKTSKRYTVYNGPLECKFFRYDLYQGSKKVKNEDSIEG